MPLSKQGMLRHKWYQGSLSADVTALGIIPGTVQAIGAAPSWAPSRVRAAMREDPVFLSGFEPGICCTVDKHANHYTTETPWMLFLLYLNLDKYSVTNSLAKALGEEAE